MKAFALQPVEFYALHDGGLGGTIPVPNDTPEVLRQHALKLNGDGYGIFKTVNLFEGPRRIENLLKIRSWYCEIDAGSKAEQWKRIEECPTYPSRVVESKRGYHIYFDAVDARLENYKEIQARIGHYFHADKVVRDVARILREPGFNHVKDPSSPFLVREVLTAPVTYTEDLIRYFFKSPPEVEKVKPLKERVVFEGDDLTEFLNSLDHEQALAQLSGKSCVGFETYKFKTTGRGRKNIIVNGKQSACFIDEHGRIGAVPGGPTIFQWLKYFNHDNKTIYQIIKEEFFK